MCLDLPRRQWGSQLSELGDRLMDMFLKGIGVVACVVVGSVVIGNIVGHLIMRRLGK